MAPLLPTTSSGVLDRAPVRARDGRLARSNRLRFAHQLDADELSRRRGCRARRRSSTDESQHDDERNAEATHPRCIVPHAARSMAGPGDTAPRPRAARTSTLLIAVATGAPPAS